MKQLLKHVSALVGLSLLTSVAGPGELSTVWLSDDLIGMKVISTTGENLGKIEDVVVHPGGLGSYAVLSFGGWLGMGDKLFALPWTVLKEAKPEPTKPGGPEGLVLALDKERLKTAPGFDKKSWPMLANPDWNKDIDAFYLGDANPNLKRPLEASARTSVITWRLSELKGFDVETPKGEELGEIKEVALDMNGRVNYVALSVGGFLGMGDRLTAVPWDELKFSLGGDKGDKKVISLARTKEEIEKAPEFLNSKEHRAEMRNAQWITSLYDHYGRAYYWKTTTSGRSPEPK